MATLDYASILQAGQQLVPNIREQAYQREVMDFRREQMQAQRAKAEAEAQEQAAYKAQLEEALLSNNPRDILRLMARFPNMADAVKPVWESMDASQREADLTQMGTIYARAQAQDFQGAAQALRARVEADREAGQVDPADEAVLAGLESDDPIQRNAAVATIGIQLAALTGDKFAETYGKLNPSENKTAVQREYDWRVNQFGLDAANRWLATQDESLVAVEPGGSVYRKSDFIGGMNAGARMAPTMGGYGGGEFDTRGRPVEQTVTGAAIEQAALAAVPGAVVTSRQRSPEHNRRVGGVANSYHLTDQARDFVPPRGMSMGQLAARLKAAMPGFDVINEGDHVHVEPRGRPSSGPVQVRTRQEYDRLAPGTPYVAPDGSQRVKS